MAKRKQLFHPDEVKQKIQATQLIKRLTENALGEKEIMTPGQIQSANILLKKAVPDQKAVEHAGHLDTTVTFNVFRQPKPEK